MAYKKFKYNNKERTYTIDQLKDKVLYFINYRMRSKKEVFDKLQKLNALPEDSTLIVDELIELGLINDEKFIEFFVREFFEIKKLGLSRVNLELRRLGFDSVLIQDSVQQYILQEEYSPEDEALELIEQKYRTSLPEDHKIIAFLGRRGFSYSIANNALSIHKKKKEE